jgi:hypothetical protein
MVDIDKMRIAAVRALEALGYTYRNDEWTPAAATIMPVPLTAEADTLHGALVRRADALAGCTDGSQEEAELKTIIEAIEAYEVKRWRHGKAPRRAVEAV